MSPLFSLLDSDSTIDFRILVSGSHLSSERAATICDIKSDGYTILAEIETLISGDSNSSRLKTASNLLIASIDIVRAFDPNLIVFAGDREDVLVAAMIGAFLGIPTAHFFAGDHASDGHIDNPIRHATSKLSTVMFVSHPDHVRRLKNIGECEDRIFNIGSVALDKFLQEPILNETELLLGLGIRDTISSRFALFIFHPLEREIEISRDVILHSVRALIDKGFHVFVGSPNTDPGNVKIQSALLEI
jgi:UDP-hydrolysing UDP-N-acetyl-D-glucosamine 2-epimerase